MTFLKLTDELGKPFLVNVNNIVRIKPYVFKAQDCWWKTKIDTIEKYTVYAQESFDDIVSMMLPTA